MSADSTAQTIVSDAARAHRRALRRRLVDSRVALAADDLASFSTAIQEHLRLNFPQLATMRVGFYWPIQGEADLRPLIEAWIAQGEPGFTALLPVVVERGAALVFRGWDPQVHLASDACGILAPAAGETQRPQALLIPVNGFDAAGYRLGYGGGFFDRTLAALDPRPLSIGVGFELSRVDSVRPEAHDVRLDAIVTEAGVFVPESS